MAEKLYRLHNDKEIQYVLQRGYRVKQAKLISIRWIKKSNNSQNRVVVIVSNQVSRKATVRNKVKRRLRALMALFSNNLCRGVDMAIIAHPGITEIRYQELKKILYDTLIKAGLRHDKPI